MKQSVWEGLIAIVACAALATAAGAAGTSAGGDAPFKGKIGRTEDQSSPDWPKAPQAPAGAPNIVLILLDDVGFGATATFGGAVRTPVLDQLAAGGLRYNQFHTTGLCSPTRAALLSGRNHHRAGFGTVGERGYPGYNGVWRKDTVALPEVLRRNGYSTAAFGKWHNTPIWETTPTGPFDHWPTSLGFEYYYGFLFAESSQWEPWLYRNTVPVEPAKKPEEGYHLTTDLVDDAIRWLHTHEAVVAEKPYFLYFATGATHAPHHVPKEWIEKYKGQFDQGWDKLREETFARQQRLGVIPAHAELTPRPKELPAWDSLSVDQKRLYAHQMEVYAGFLAQTDFEIGRLLEAVRRGPNADNTLVLYIIGDNGGSGEGSLDGGDNNSAWFVGQPVASVAQQLQHLGELGSPLYDNHYAAAWAWATSTPFQWMKQVASHFGATRNPLIVSWPARLQAHGELRTQFTHVNDIAPTIYELVGIQFPSVVDGVKQVPLDGTSFAASLKDPAAKTLHRIQYFEMTGNRAIYQDGWMASAFHAVPWTRDRSNDFDHDRWELYHVDEDFSQAHDVAARYPQKLKALQQLFETEAKKNNVFPLNNFIKFDQTLPSPLRGKQHFVYYPDIPPLPPIAAPAPLGSHQITAEVVIPAAGAEGVIFASGGRQGGFSLYIKDGRLVYEQNFFREQHETVRSTAPLPTGKVQLSFEFERHGTAPWAGGTVRLRAQGQVIGEGELSRVGFPSMFDTVDVGQDRGSPVSDSYAVPFRFTGKVERVELELR